VFNALIRERQRRLPIPTAAPAHPHSVPILESEDPVDAAVEQPFVEGAQDAIDADLRHRMIRESAYHRYTASGYADGYDLDD